MGVIRGLNEKRQIQTEILKHCGIMVISANFVLIRTLRSGVPQRRSMICAALQYLSLSYLLETLSPWLPLLTPNLDHYPESSLSSLLTENEYFIGLSAFTLSLFSWKVYNINTHMHKWSHAENQNIAVWLYQSDHFYFPIKVCTVGVACVEFIHVKATQRFHVIWPKIITVLSVSAFL